MSVFLQVDEEEGRAQQQSGESASSLPAAKRNLGHGNQPGKLATTVFCGLGSAEGEPPRSGLSAADTVKSPRKSSSGTAIDDRNGGSGEARSARRDSHKGQRAATVRTAGRGGIITMWAAGPPAFGWSAVIRPVRL